MKIKSPHLACLAGLTTETWLQHVEFLLSAEVCGLEIKSVDGRVLAAPSWALVLSYDHEIRRKAFKEVNMRGRSIKDALKAAQASTELREIFLTTPMRFPAAAHSAGSSDEPRLQPPRAQMQPGDELKREQDSKGTRRTKKPKNQAAKGGQNNRSPPWQQAKPALPVQSPAPQAKRQKGQMADGRKKCYGYQKGQCKRDQCALAHVCDKCEKGPIDCPRPGQCR